MSERDPELDALWRRHSAETPPAALDDAIRAAAHRAVHAKPSATLPRARAPWPAWATFAAAASIGAIAIGVWQLQPRDVDETQMVASDVPARAGAPRPVVAPPEARTTPTPSGSVAPPETKMTPTPNGLPPPAAVARDRKTTPTPNDTANGAVVAQDKQTTLTPKTPKTTPTPNLDIGAPKPSPFPAAIRAAPSERERASAPPESPVVRELHAPSPVTNEAQAPSAAAGNAASGPRMASAPMAMKRNADAKRFEADATRADAGAASTDAASSQPGASAPRAQAGGVAAPAQRGALRSVDDFVDAIRRALAEHRDADAVAALATMRAQYADADARLPADLRAWAARVQRVPVN